MDFKQELIKSIQTIVNNSLGNYRADRTFKSIIKDITPKGYVILDETGSKRTVKCCIPNIDLKLNQGVWVKIPLNQLNDIHICGVL